MVKFSLPHLCADRYAFTTPTPEGIEHIAENMREADKEEVYATVGHRRYADALRLSAAASDSVVMGVTVFGEPAALFGVSTVSLLYNTGGPWMLATPSADRHRRAFIEAGRAYTQYMLAEYTALENYVDARNHKSVAWLQHLGFSVGEQEPYGAFDMPFRRFRIERAMPCVTQEL